MLSDGVLRAGGPEFGFARRIELFLKRRALDLLSREVAEFAAAAGVAAASVTVGDAGTRWGSCSSRGAIRFSWRLILAPPACAATSSPTRSRIACTWIMARGSGRSKRACSARRGRGEGDCYGGSDRGCVGIGRSALTAGCGWAASGAAAAAGARREGLIELLLSGCRFRPGGPLAGCCGICGAGVGGVPRRHAVFVDHRLGRCSRPPAGRRRAPLPGSAANPGIGTCVSNCSTGRFAVATIMKSWKARAGAVPP